MASRKQNEIELDRIIESWTSLRDRDWMVNEFCKAGLAASPSREGRDVYADPHFRKRNVFLQIEHPEIGRLEIIDTPWKINGLQKPNRHAPLLGEHNDYVLKELLGLSDQEVEDLQEKESSWGTVDQCFISIKGSSSQSFSPSRPGGTAQAVPSTQKGLTDLFEMGTGVAPSALAHLN